MPDGSVALSPQAQVDGLTVFVSVYPDDSFRFIAQMQRRAGLGLPGVDTSPSEIEP